MQIFFIVLLLIVGFLWVIGVLEARHVLETAPDAEEPVGSTKTWLIALAIVVTLIIQLWMLRIVYKCFLYIQNRFD